MCRLLFGRIIVSWTIYLVTKSAWRFLLLTMAKVDGESLILLFARYRALAVGWGLASSCFGMIFKHDYFSLFVQNVVFCISTIFVKIPQRGKFASFIKTL